MESPVVRSVCWAVGNTINGVSGIFRAITTRGMTEEDHSFQKPKPTDRRSPCPMLNSLANHGYLPRDGKDISLARFVTALKESINLAPGPTLFFASAGLPASTTGNFLTLHLDDLNKHGVIEHDGSLSRQDTFSGNNHSFSPKAFATMLAHFGADNIISIEEAAEARAARLAEAPKSNPEFHMSPAEHIVSATETALYLLAFGHGTDGYANKEWVRTMFEEERLPFEEGFKRPRKSTGFADILSVTTKVLKASR
ncbi:Chloroperoxidase [Podospora didyma]|uniref:Chloroperoxidase n=1 Tax=Podospora didyma TaxID=330526 RepID=A0AAE0K4M6_9PEZI|nr:Chloroperoxidase [Podospora didyma]